MTHDGTPAHDPATRDGLAVEGHLPGARGNKHVDEHLSKLAIRMIEMEQGLRPVSTLDGQSSPMAARRIRHLVHAATLGRPRGARRTAPTRVMRTFSSHPSAGAVEGCVILQCDGRVRALSFRLEQEGDRWWIVDLSPPDAALAAAVTAASRTGHVPLGPDGRRWSSGRIEEDDLDVVRPVDRADSSAEEAGPD